MFTADRRSNADAESFRESLTVRGAARAGARLLDPLDRKLIFPLDYRVGYSIAITAQGTDDRRNLAWDTVRQAIDAARGLADQRRGNTPPRPLQWLLPIVVTTAPLFSVHLHPETGEPEVERVERVPMLAQVPQPGVAPRSMGEGGMDHPGR